MDERKQHAIETLAAEQSQAAEQSHRGSVVRSLVLWERRGAIRFSVLRVPDPVDKWRYRIIVHGEVRRCTLAEAHLIVLGLQAGWTAHEQRVHAEGGEAQTT